jgi:hypothetical protein
VLEIDSQHEQTLEASIEVVLWLPPEVLSTCGQLGVDTAIMSAMNPATRQNTPVTDNPLSYAGYRFPPDVISYAIWLYYRFPLSLRMVEELLAARGIELTYETVRRWSVKFGLAIARRIRSTALCRGDKWHLEKWSSRLSARGTGCGARWTSMERCSMCWCKPDATGTRPGGSCASC